MESQSTEPFQSRLIRHDQFDQLQTNWQEAMRGQSATHRKKTQLTRIDQQMKAIEKISCHVGIVNRQSNKLIPLLKPLLTQNRSRWNQTISKKQFELFCQDQINLDQAMLKNLEQAIISKKEYLQSLQQLLQEDAAIYVSQFDQSPEHHNSEAHLLPNMEELGSLLHYFKGVYNIFNHIQMPQQVEPKREREKKSHPHYDIEIEKNSQQQINNKKVSKNKKKKKRKKFWALTI